METLRDTLVVLALVVQPLVLIYFLAHNSYMLSLVARSARHVRRRVAGHFVEDLDLIDQRDLTRPVTIIVPAFNEEVTIVDCVTSLMQCDYPRFELVVVNGGSTDGTLDQLRQKFRLRRTEVPYRKAISTAPVRAMYEATVPLPVNVTRVVVIDKENGGKADALNAGINASMAPYFVSIDADLMLDQRGLKELMRVFLEDPRVVAAGGQVAIANGSTVRGRRVVSVGLPARSLARFQVVEYLRSFTIARAGRGRIRPLLMQSRLFAVFEKETVIRAGGYLTPFLNHRLTTEYIGRGVGAVDEGIEVMVRLHRFLLDKLQDSPLVFLPHTVAWTHAPETLQTLRRQHGLWYQGLRETLRYHREMVWGRLFEYYGPLIEIAAYLSIVFLLIMQWVLDYPLIGPVYLWAFLLASVGYGALVNVLAVVIGAWRFRYGVADRAHRHLLPFTRRRDVMVLLVYAVLEHLGYRQLTLWWRLRALWEARRGEPSWRKFVPVGLSPVEARVHG